MHGESHSFQCPGRTFRGVQVKAQFVVFAGYVHDFMFVAVADGEQDAAFLVHIVSGGDQPLVEGFFQIFADTQHFAGGFHFRPQGHVHVGQFLKREHRHFAGHIRRRAVQSCAVAQVAEFFAQHGAGGQIHHGHAGHFADVRDGAGGAGIDLDNVDYVFIHYILNIDQTAGVESQGQVFGVGDQIFGGFAVQVPSGVHGDGVAGMDAGALDVLHNAGDQDVFAVTDSVHFQFSTHQVLVDQHRILDFVAEDDVHIFSDIVVGEGDNHVLAAQHIAGAHQNGVADFVGRFQCFFAGHDSMAGSALDVQRFQQFVKTLAVFGHVDGIAAGADDVYAVALQEFGQIDSGLTAESDHNAVGLFCFDDVHHVLAGQRLEVQPVCCVEVC